MSKLFIQGADKLHGELSVQGSKNSSLPILAATILCSHECVLHNCPRLSDVDASIKILKHLGAMAFRNGDSIVVNSSGVCRCDIPDILMREMRSSIIFLGAMVSKFGRVLLSFPGGCKLGARPIDLHLKSLKKMGLNVIEEQGYLDCSSMGRLKGAHITLTFPSVGATENIILAAVIAQGTTVIRNPAREPEIYDLCNFLNKCGAKIRGAGTGEITIIGVERLHGTEHTIIPDRIVATTFMTAAAVTRGDLILHGVNPRHLGSIMGVFVRAGCLVRSERHRLRIRAPIKTLSSIGAIKTLPYPGFPTDAQALIMVMAAVADGTSVFIENIFENRYRHVPELVLMGADIHVANRTAIVKGVPCLTGASVKATDLRGGAAMIVAGLAADGQTEISELSHLDRGYEDIDEKLQAIGANIKRI